MYHCVMQDKEVFMNSNNSPTPFSFRLQSQTSPPLHANLALKKTFDGTYNFGLCIWQQ